MNRLLRCVTTGALRNRGTFGQRLPSAAASSLHKFIEIRHCASTTAAPKDPFDLSETVVIDWASNAKAAESTAKVEVATADLPLHKTMRAERKSATVQDGRPDRKSVYNGLVKKDVAVVKTPASGFRFVPIPGSKVDSTRSDFLYFYRGHWEDGLPHGKGSLTFPNQHVYTGDMNRGKCEGKGVERTAEGELRYEGEWADNKPNGMGRMRCYDGGVYTGHVVIGSREGQGRLQLENGSVYEGGWEANVKHGAGVITEADGRQFAVQYDRGQRRKHSTVEITPSSSTSTVAAANLQQDGDSDVGGVRVTAAGAVPREQHQSSDSADEKVSMSEGTVSAGKEKKGSKTASKEGKLAALELGKVKNSGKVDSKKEPTEETGPVPVSPSFFDAHHYAGDRDLATDLPHGQGRCVYQDGSVYEGAWEQGRRHGRGTQTWQDGAVYTGDWVRGVRQGRGAVQHADGSRWEGAWERNVFSTTDCAITLPSGVVYECSFEQVGKLGKRRGTVSELVQKPTGDGKIRYPDGTQYVGWIKEGLRHGRGRLLDSEGAVLQDGKWKADAFVAPTATRSRSVREGVDAEISAVV